MVHQLRLNPATEQVARPLPRLAHTVAHLKHLLQDPIQARARLPKLLLKVVLLILLPLPLHPLLSQPMETDKQLQLRLSQAVPTRLLVVSLVAVGNQDQALLEAPTLVLPRTRQVAHIQDLVASQTL